MSVDPMEEQIRLYAKQLKLPTFTRYPDILRKAGPDTRFDELLLDLMKAETAKNRRFSLYENAGRTGLVPI